MWPETSLLLYWHQSYCHISWITVSWRLPVAQYSYWACLHLLHKNAMLHLYSSGLINKNQTCQNQMSGNTIFFLLVVTLDTYSCMDPGIPVNGLRLSHDLSIGSVVSFQCDPGYRLSHEDPLVCEKNHFWSHPLPSCDGTYAKCCSAWTQSANVMLTECKVLIRLLLTVGDALPSRTSTPSCH